MKRLGVDFKVDNKYQRNAISTISVSIAHMQASGFLLIEKLYRFPGVYGVVDPHRPISNSDVKRYSGENSWRAASCKDSSMPGFDLRNPLILY
jgi:hypothetical protein